MGLSMIDLFCESFDRVPQRIVLDIDDTDDAVHGGQQLALFNAQRQNGEPHLMRPWHVDQQCLGGLAGDVAAAEFFDKIEAEIERRV